MVKTTKLEALYEKLSEERSRDEKKFLGKVLTIVDASIADAEQRKALKDLVNNAFYGDEVTESYAFMRWELALFGETLGLEAWFTKEGDLTLPKVANVANRYEDLPNKK